MSVKKGDRGKQKLGVLEAAKEMIKYTHDRVKDNQIFPKSERWILAKEIWDCAAGAYTNIVRANSIRVETKAEAETRLLMEKEALGWMDTLMALIDIANVMGYIGSDRTEFWTGLCNDVLVPLDGWIRQQRKQYRKYVKEEQEQEEAEGTEGTEGTEETEDKGEPL